MSAALRDPAAPLPLPPSWPRRRTRIPLCGYVLDPMTLRRCPEPAVYVLRVRGWEPAREGFTCAEHAQVARRWALEWMRSITADDVALRRKP